MRAFHDYIVNQIKTNLGYPTVERWNDQEVETRERKWEQVLFPAVFLEYITVETNALGAGIIDQEIRVRVRVATENYKYTKKDSYDKVTEVSNFLERLRGNEADAVQFTSFEEVNRDYDDNGDSMVFDIIDYRTVYRNLEVYNSRNSGQMVVKPVSPNVIKA